MSKQKPTIPKGTRDFGPVEMGKRNFLLNTIRGTFQKFGFMPLETPSMENLSVLTGKYGDEGDQLLYKILNSGDFLKKTTEEDFKKGAASMLPKIAEKGLRYDLTVPFARYVVMNRHELNLPFKRFQMQPVWRADRPQKGRYREFLQCDADVVGTKSLLCEAEIVMMINETFEKLGIKDFSIHLNHRKVLSGITQVIGAKGKETEFCVAIDKIDKIGKEGVENELSNNGFSEEAIQKLQPLLILEGDNEQMIESLKSLLPDSEEGQTGIAELEQVLQLVDAFGQQTHHVVFDLTLARGLSYYTGAIFEVKIHNAGVGSVSGGGRYDDLTGVFGLPDLTGVGFSFGVDRLYDAMESLQLFPKSSQAVTQLLLCPFDEDAIMHALPILKQLRAAGIASELYPEPAKMKKQLNYADKKAIPFVVVIGSDEIKTQQYGLKNMKTGVQDSRDIDGIITAIRQNG